MEAREQKTQRRYSPEVRRSMILDTAAEMISSEGVSTLTMERISESADISKSLVYKYFDSLTELLQTLLRRELRELRLLQLAAAEKAETFEELVRNVTHEYLKYIDERGLIIERLQADPAISDMHDPTGYNRAGAVEYLADILVKHFELPLELARATTDISFGLPASAGDFLLRSDMSREEVEDLTVSMIVGTFVAVRNDHLTRRQKLKR